jgi:hypothetical protein
MAARGFLRPGCISGGADRDSEREGSFLVSHYRRLRTLGCSIDCRQVFNENGGVPLPQQRKRLPIYGNRDQFL